MAITHPETHKQKSGLSKGAEPGVALAVILLAFIICVATILLVRRRYKLPRSNSVGQHPAGSGLGGTEYSAHELKSEGCARIFFHKAPFTKPFQQSEQLNVSFQPLGDTVDHAGKEERAELGTCTNELLPSDECHPSISNPASPGIDREATASQKHKSIPHFHSTEL